MKPVLLIDVDGVVNAFSRKPTKLETHGYRRTAATVTVRGEEVDRELVLHDANLELLKGMDEDFDLVWCSSWNEQANTVLAPIIGFPELPILRVGDKPAHKIYDEDRVLWKTPKVMQAFSEGGEYYGRQFAWLDDSTRRVDRNCVDEVFSPDHHRLTLIQSNMGFTDFHRRACMAWKAFSFVH